MYSAAVVAARLAEVLEGPLKGAFPQGIIRHPVAVCQTMQQRLAGAWDPRKGIPTRPLNQDEQAFIQNERLLCKLDFAYWAERYAYIIRPDRGVSPMYPLWESQRLILAALAHEEERRWKSGHPDGLIFNLLKGRQLGACLDPTTRVLTADLRWVPIGDLMLGTEVVAVEEQIPGGKGAARKMRTAVVEARETTWQPAVEIVFASGTSVVCSPDHRWLYRTRTQTTWDWRSVSAMRVGGHIRRAADPWGASCLEDYWMGGMLDGEGSCAAKSSGGAELCVAQRQGPVFERLRTYFTTRGYAAKEDADQAVRRSKFGRTPVPRFSLSRMNELFQLIGQTRPTRFIDRRWWEGKELPGKRNGNYGRERIVAIRPLGRRALVDLQTSTGTFIAEGLVSHNSTLCQSFLAHRITTQSYTKGMIASDVPENSGSTGLFGMLELVVEHLPWWLLPRERFHQKDQHLVFENHSSVVVESGKSMKGGKADDGGQKGQIGRSKTYSMVHLSELSTWESPQTIDDSLGPAVAATPRTLWARESTAKGRHNWWHQEWLAAEQGVGRAFNVFIPWYAERSKYWLPVPADWTPPEYCTQYAARVAQASARWMRRDFQLSLEQLYWYYSSREAAEAKGILYKFLEEYPSEPAEAFQYSGRGVFTPEQIDRLRQVARPIRVLYQVQPATLITQIRDEILAERQSAQDLDRLRPLSDPTPTSGDAAAVEASLAEKEGSLP